MHLGRVIGRLVCTRHLPGLRPSNRGGRDLALHRADSSSSPPHPETAIASAITTAVANLALNFRRELPIRGSAESHNADTMDTR